MQSKPPSFLIALSWPEAQILWSTSDNRTGKVKGLWEGLVHARVEGWGTVNKGQGPSWRGLGREVAGPHTLAEGP